MTTEETLIKVFSAFANVVSCKVIRDKSTQQSKRYAFVEYGSVEEATYALEHSEGLLVNGVPVNITYARREHLQPIIPEGFAIDADTYAQWNSVYDYKEEHDGISGYQFDENSGYYYNSKLGYYFDPKSGYYYNGKEQSWMYFDQEKKKIFKI